MRAYTLHEIQEVVSRLAKQYGAKRVYLFGSYARGTATEESDIDLLVDTTGTSLTSLLALGALYCDLEDALKKPIDLITSSSLEQRAQMPSDLDFRKTVMEERVKLYAVA